MRKHVFIVGSPRSGTSLLCHALKSAAGYQGFAEGQVFSLIFPLMRALEQHYAGVKSVANHPNHMVSRFPLGMMEEVILGNFRDLASGALGDQPWIDKTAGEPMIRSSAYLKKIWPDSFFIFAQRRGIENVLSRQRKFPALPFELNCKYWAACMTAWKEVSPALGEQCCALDQIDLDENPDQVACALAHHLWLSSDVAKQIGILFKRTRPEDTGGRSRTRVSLESCGWNAAEQQTFLGICGGVSSDFGYTTDASYSTKPTIPAIQAG